MKPISIAVLLLPGFSNLALSALIEPFHLANRAAGETVFSWTLKSLTGHPVTSASGIAVHVSSSVEQHRQHSEVPLRTDVLAVLAGQDIGRSDQRTVASLVRKCFGTRTEVFAVGTAAWQLAEAGLLRNVRCTLHWSRMAAFTECFDEPLVEDALFVHDGLIWTCAGELASFDLALHYIGKLLGEEIVHEVCRQATVDRPRPGSKRQTGPAGLAYSAASDRLVKAMQTMEDNIEYPLPLGDVAKEAGISRRQLERLFRTHVKVTPARYYLKVRLAYAKRLIEDTRIPLTQVALACGFSTSSSLSRHFRVEYAISPSEGRSRQSPQVPLSSMGEAKGGDQRRRNMSSCSL